MSKRLLFLLLPVLLLTSAWPLGAEQAVVPEYGPATGTLVIVGGAMSENFGIPQKFIQLAGGPGKKVVIVPTNGGNKGADGAPVVYKEETVLAAWKKRGLTNVVMLHTWDPKVADTEAFVTPLLDANAVWFDGGRQWNMVDSSSRGAQPAQRFRGTIWSGGTPKVPTS